jgi:hypothetical protein
MNAKDKVRNILDGFLPAMAKIQDSQATDEEKKRVAKEWLRARLDVFLSDEEKSDV